MNFEKVAVAFTGNVIEYAKKTALGVACRARRFRSLNLLSQRVPLGSGTR